MSGTGTPDQSIPTSVGIRSRFVCETSSITNFRKNSPPDSRQNLMRAHRSGSSFCVFFKKKNDGLKPHSSFVHDISSTSQAHDRLRKVGIDAEMCFSAIILSGIMIPSLESVKSAGACGGPRQEMPRLSWFNEVTVELQLVVGVSCVLGAVES